MLPTALVFVALFAVPVPGEPAPARELPEGLESAPWEPLQVEQCKERLAAAGLTEHFYFSPHNRLQERKLRGHATIYCHAPQATIWTRGPTGARYYGFSLFNCAMSLAMTRFERIAQEEAHRVFETKSETPISAISHMGTYNCRRLRAKPERQSQHSFGNAIDLAGFYVDGVGEVTIRKDWVARWPSQQRKSDFLRSLVERLRAEQVFTNVLDPSWDEAHVNHLHMDLAALSDGLPSWALAVTRALPITAAADPPPDHDRTHSTQ